MKLLFAAAEMFPFAKSGGLADIAHALPKALANKIEVTAVMPLYRFVDRERYGIEPTGEHFTFQIGGATRTAEIFSAIHDGVLHLFVYNEALSDKEGIYGPPGGCYPDNDIRFALFCHAVAELSKRLGVHIVHLNDWHTALAAPLLKERGIAAKTVYTIHNLAYQGIFPAESLAGIGLSPHHFTMKDMEFYGAINWMKGGIRHSDLVTTVSPSYALEIQRAEYGCGLDGFICEHRHKLYGILNGIDEAFYDPSSDPALPFHFSKKRLLNKKRCKKAYLEEIDINKYEFPLFVFIGRFVEQKGLDWIIEAIDTIGEMPLFLSILGSGDARYHALLEEAAKRHERIVVRFGYDETLSHRMYAAADFLLMPSLFEPCGLNQMIAMRYGTIPVVHRVGGLRDTVHAWHAKEPLCGKGIFFEESDATAMVSAMKEALDLYAKKPRFNRVRSFDMVCDFSIRKCAEHYLSLYRRLV
ncbi:glycogen synthase [Hydrogenimonas urashimensis]|uniref:glycogen synthase n=1 Tax=Hydrogenimonas urashimensis TaxID=2740515 RepID=UPI0019152BDE|nr:glycogen synthase [Hydrogenimonas urashimensis]